MKCFIVSIIYILHIVQGQICQFYRYNADCRYRVDGVAMGHIIADVNYCNDPVDVTFSITCDKPTVSWSHTYSNDNEIIEVKGFDEEVRLQVMLKIDNEDRLWVRAIFNVDGQPRTYFMDQRVHLTNLEQCIQLNAAGQIAIGILGALVAIAAVLLVTLLVIRHRIKKGTQQRLVENMESQSDNRSSVTSSDGGVYMMQCEPIVRYLHTIPERSETDSVATDGSTAVAPGNINIFIETNEQAVSENGQVVSENGQVVSENGQAVSENNGQVVSENNELVVSENNGLVVSQNNGLVVSENNGLVVSEINGLVVSENNGLVVSEINGQAVSEINGLVVSEISGQVVSENNGQVVSEINGQAVSEINREVVSEINRDVVSENNGQVVSENNTQVVSEINRELVSQNNTQVLTDAAAEEMRIGSSENGIILTTNQNVAHIENASLGHVT